MMRTIKSHINEMNYMELENMSLLETLLAEEALCDSISPEFLRETADMPYDTTSIKELLRGTPEYDQYSKFNQNYVLGMSQDEADDYYDSDDNLDGREYSSSDHVGGGGIHDDEDDYMCESTSAFSGYGYNGDYVTRAVADMANGDLSVMHQDIPDNFDYIMTGGNVLRRATIDSKSQAYGVPINLDNILNHDIKAADIVGQVNNYHPNPTQRSAASDFIPHPTHTHVKDTEVVGDGGNFDGGIQESSRLVSNLLGESSEDDDFDLDNVSIDDDYSEDDDDLDMSEESSDDFDFDI